MSRTPERVTVEVQKVAAMLLTARRLLAGGTMVDLAALQGMVSGVCDQVATLPREEGRALLPGLESLLRGLGYLGDDLDTLQARLTGGETRGATP
jgi:hypothetical protein